MAVMSKKCQRPYHLILMMLLGMIILEAERTILFSTEICASSYIGRIAPKVKLPAKPPQLTNINNVTTYTMCVEEKKPVEDIKVKPDPEKVEEVKFHINMTQHLEYNLLMSANQVGIFLTTVPAGFAAVCCAGHNVLLTGQLIMATSTMILPLVINIYWPIAVILEVLVGAGMAIMLPSVFTIMADWEHVEWKTTIICLCLAGRPLGQLASYTLSSVTCPWEFFPGWIMSHLIIGFVGLLWCGLWMWLGHPSAPCASCVYECSICCNETQEKPKIPVCTQRMIMMKVWNTVAKQPAVWGIVFAWSASDMMWMLLETYSVVLSKINFLNEIWFSGSLIATAFFTILAGILADRIIDCSPESYRYIRKIFDSLGKVFVILFSILIVRLQFNCTQWLLIMSVIAMVSVIHCLQFAGCYSNCVDIGDPCTGVTVSMALIFSSLSRLGMWNGLFYSVPFGLELLRFEPPLYATSAILGSSIIIYALFGTPDINLYLPADWSDLVPAHHNGGSPCCGSLCCVNEQPHKHILKIMDQACRGSISVHGPSPMVMEIDVSRLAVDEADYRPRGSVVSFSDSPPSRNQLGPTSGILRKSPDLKVQFSGEQSHSNTLELPSFMPSMNNYEVLHTSPVIPARNPLIRVQHVAEDSDDSDWPPPPMSRPVSGSPKPVPSPRLHRDYAIDHNSTDNLCAFEEDQAWLRTESEL